MKRFAMAMAVGLLAVSGTASADDEVGAGLEARGKKMDKFLKKSGLTGENLAKAKELWAEWVKTSKPLRAWLAERRYGALTTIKGMLGRGVKRLRNRRTPGKAAGEA